MITDTKVPDIRIQEKKDVVEPTRHAIDKTKTAKWEFPFFNILLKEVQWFLPRELFV